MAQFLTLGKYKLQFTVFQAVSDDLMETFIRCEELTMIEVPPGAIN